MSNKFRTKTSEENSEQKLADAEPKKLAEQIEKPKKQKAKAIENKANNASPKISIKQRIELLINFYQKEQTQKITGLLLILFSIYLGVAFASYVFTWEVDQDKIVSGALFLNETKVENWLGKFGALIAHAFIYKGFGMASLILVPVLFIFGIKKLTLKPFKSLAGFNAKWLFITVWSSMVLGYLYNDKLYFLGGGFAYSINNYLSSLIGAVGLPILLVFSLLAFLVLSINLNFDFLIKKQKSDSDGQTNEAETELVNETQNYNSEINELQISPEEEAELNNFEIKQKGDDLVIEPVENTNNSGIEVTAPGNESIIKPIEDENNVELSSNIETVNNSIKNAEPEFEIEQALEAEAEVLSDENKAQRLVEKFGEYDPTLDLGSYQFPTFDLLFDYPDSKGKVTQEELVANKDKIVLTLKNFGIEIDRIMATVGPTVTLYEIVPAPGVRISKIKNLEDDIALSLAALGIRIIAPMPGKGTIGIEVPNQNPEMVPMKNILASDKFNNSLFELPIALGKTISNEIFVADLTKMPHLLMAGATGQGKSVGLNAVLVSLLYKKHPAQVKFVLVDPKKVELTLFKQIERHFLAKLPNAEEAIITDNTKVIHTLNSLCIEMDNRYALLEDAQVRNIKEYNAKFINRKLNPNEGHKYLPYIVLVVDEFADLIMTAGKEVETPIARLAQLARAVGIHLIIATQRPSVNIITGTIKANFPARIAFRVTSKIDSRTILDGGGADQLVGRGDMLLSTGNDLIRIQCAFVDTPEVDKITEFIGSQRAYPSAFLLPEYVGEDGSDGKEAIDLSERDKEFENAAKLVVQFQQGSASFLQRKLKLGYNRAGRIVDQLEAAGIIGPFEGSKAREVRCKTMEDLQQILDSIK
ncbi:MAG: DNA translocase FtsK 4TM domain-containing protein [Bacteroidetes bacterium]|nr:DNA translocase FtsK 4TM domain-containing protein [Bacteroidota bacterium]